MLPFQTSRESSKIFVAKIPHFATEAEAHGVFSRFGEIEETKLLYNEDGIFRGCAFIKFKRDEFAHNALELNGQAVFAKETLVVRMAEDKRTNQKKKLEAQRQSINLPSKPLRRQPVNDDAIVQLPHTDLPGNFNDLSKWENVMEDLIKNEGCDILLQKGISQWTEYRSPDGLPYFHNAATGLCQWFRPKEIDTVPSEDDERTKYTFGPSGCNLFVFHLPDEWTDENLYANFIPFGNIISAKVMKETVTQRSRGFGFVSYDSRDSATLAIKKMQGHKEGNKRLKVEFKKGETPGSLFDDTVVPKSMDIDTKNSYIHDENQPNVSNYVLVSTMTTRSSSKKGNNSSSSKEFEIETPEESVLELREPDDLLRPEIII